MNGLELDYLLQKVPWFGGIIDYSTNKIRLGYIYVLFTGVTPIGHWVVVDLKNNYFFDSLGRPPAHYGLPAMKFNHRMLQHPSSDLCGVYCMYYVINGVKGLKRFTSDTKKNDTTILKWLELYLEDVMHI